MSDEISTEADSSPTVAITEGAGILLDVLRRQGPKTISELAAGTGMSRSTVMQRIDLLHERSLVTKEAQTAGARGRPAAVARFNPASGVVLAAQIGMTGSRFAAMDLGGELLAECFLTLDIPAGPAKLLADVSAGFDALISESGSTAADVVGIGVGMPSSLELLIYARRVGAVDDKWDREYFKSRLGVRFHAPVFVDLDVNLLALAERRKSWPDSEVFVCVKLGTLIDASILINGVPIRGVSGLAGEFGHMKVPNSDVPCSCGSIGCLDAVASGNAIVAQLRQAGFAVSHVSDVLELARAKHPEATFALRKAGRSIGEALASVVNLLNPDVIATWGYLTEAETSLFAGIREGLYQNSLPDSSEQMQLVLTSLGDLAGVYGAASMVLDELFQPSNVDSSLLST